LHRGKVYPVNVPENLGFGGGNVGVEQ